MQKTVLLLVMLILCSCAGMPAEQKTEHDKKVDPLQSWNYRVFSFNEALDKYFLKPVAVSYRWVTPEAVDQGVTNFFSNLADIPDAINAMLQLKAKKSGLSLSRFLSIRCWV